MTTVDHTTRSPSRAPRHLGRKVAAITFGLAGAIAVGFISSLVRPEDQRLLVILVFAACTLPVLAALAWVILVPTYGRPSHPEDTVEHRWYSDATAGAFGDILLTAGLALTALSLTSIEVAGTTVLLALLIGMMIDVIVRYQVLKARANRA